MPGVPNFYSHKTHKRIIPGRLVAQSLYLLTKSLEADTRGASTIYFETRFGTSATGSLVSTLMSMKFPKITTQCYRKPQKHQAKDTTSSWVHITYYI